MSPERTAMNAPNIAAVIIHWSEGLNAENIVCANIAEAQKQLNEVALHAPQRGGYYKTKYSVAVEVNGALNTYTGRFDVTAKAYCLAAELRANLEHAGRTHEHMPQHVAHYAECVVVLGQILEAHAAEKPAAQLALAV